MKIIADTNIWYELGLKSDLLEKVKSEPIAPTYVSIYELSKTENLFDKEEFTRSAIQQLFKFKEYVIYEPPYIYLAQLNQEYDYDIESEIGQWLNFTSKFAKGHSIEPSKIETFRNEIEQIREGLNEFANFFNEEAQKIKERITKKKDHKKLDTLQITADFINHLVEIATKGACNLKGFNLDRIELLIKTLDCYFKALETSQMKVQPNDWYDIAILAYVQPGDKFWTREKRWKNLIKIAGCEEYLYDKNNV